MDKKTRALLRQARENKGLSQYEMAVKMGYTNAQYVSNWERGVCGVPANKAKVFCQITGMKHSEMEEILIKDAIDKIKRRMSGKKTRSVAVKEPKVEEVQEA